MAGDLCIGRQDLERILTAALLKRGEGIDSASRTGRDLAEDLHHEFKGKRIIVRIERDHVRVLTPSERRRVYLRWWTDREEDHTLCTSEEISLSTLQRIQREGRKKGWGK